MAYRSMAPKSKRGGGGRSAASSSRRGLLSLLPVLAAAPCAFSLSSSSPPPPPPPPSSSSSSSSSSTFASRLRGKMILAPLTRGGNLPYRRLCSDFGCDVSLGEMVYARSLLGGDRIERARLRRAPNERASLFGVQIATNDVEEGTSAIDLIVREANKKESGAGGTGGVDFVDLNCGCPIYEATRRGLGSALLRSPDRLGRLIGGLADGAARHDMPLTVKIRLGCEDDNINVREVVRTARENGAAAVTIHGRTARQRYSKSADWDLIGQVVRDGRDGRDDDENSNVPIIGNGDILTHYEAKARMDETGVDAVMVGRGALIKPWIFKEFRDGRDYDPSIEERISIYRTLGCYMKDHFGDDDRGRKKSFYFFPWHFEFLCRYMPLPEELYGADVDVAADADADADASKPPLIQRRMIPDQQTPLETLLSHRSGTVHELIAARLWESDSDAHAIDLLSKLAESDEFQRLQAGTSGEGEEEDEVEELANIPSGDSRSGGGRRRSNRRGRNPKPKRTPEEIVAVRAERAAKKARLALEASRQGGNDE